MFELFVFFYYLSAKSSFNRLLMIKYAYQYYNIILPIHGKINCLVLICLKKYI